MNFIQSENDGGDRWSDCFYLSISQVNISMWEKANPVDRFCFCNNWFVRFVGTAYVGQPNYINRQFI